MVVTIILDIDGVSHVCRTFENESIQINKVVASIDNLGSQGTITRQSFRLPLIGGLLDAIGDVTDPSQSAKVNLNKSIKGRILVDGFERFVGSFFVVNTTKGDSKEVEMIFQGSETDLKATLSNITMAELTEGESIAYNYTEIKQCFDDPTGYRDTNGYVFPLVDFGQRFTGAIASLTKRSLTTETLFETDFKAAITIEKCLELMPFNITVNGADRLLKQAILLHNDKQRVPKLDDSEFTNTGTFISTLQQQYTNGVINKLLFQSKSVYDIANTANFDLANDEYVAPIDGNYVAQVEGSVFLSNTGTSTTSYVIELFLYESVTATRQLILSLPTTLFAGGFQSFNINVQIPKSLLLNQRISIESKTTGSPQQTSLFQGFKFAVVQAPSISPTSNIDVPANCPDVTAWDIFRTVALQCNGQIIANSDGTYEMTPFNDWIEDNDEVIILDDIIEDAVDVQIKPFSIQGAKSIRLGYKENDDFYSKKYKELTDESFGEKFIENTGTEFAKNELSIEVPFAVIPSVKIDSSEAAIPKIYDDEFKTIKGKATLLQTSETTMTQPIILGSLFSASETRYLSIPFIGNWEGLAGGYNTTDQNFGQSLSYWSSTGYPSQNLYERYWKKYLEETYSEQSREIKMNIKLNRNQIDGLKFNEKFYYKNTLLRLVKLEGISLTSDQPATATFMKRFKVYPSDIATYYPYDVINSIVQWKRSSDNVSVGDGNGETPSIEDSAIAYGFFYDSNLDIATQRGQILIT